MSKFICHTPCYFKGKLYAVGDPFTGTEANKHFSEDGKKPVETTEKASTKKAAKKTGKASTKKAAKDASTEDPFAQSGDEGSTEDKGE